LADIITIIASFGAAYISRSLIAIFCLTNFASKDLVEHASKWSVESFKRKFRSYVSSFID